ncbi:MAG: metallophosphoesterase [Elusimicrobiaceae bacterium]|nr:metallophosphoesterase [Elusimicrobiaceae bacterium]
MGKKGQRFVVIGDIHGHLEPFLQILHHAGLIDGNGDWAGATTQLLQIGDTIDRGPHSLQVEGVLDRLQEQAKQKGGEVIRLVGNHELELLLGNFSISQIPQPQLVELQQKFRQKIADGTLKAAHAYHGFLCTHAGISRRLMQVFDSQMEELTASNLALLINLIFKESVAHQFYKHPIFNISTRRSGPNRFGGIFWEDLEDLIQSYHQSPVWQVVGHTPIDHIVIDRQMQIIPIDVGLHRKEQYLEFFEGNLPKIVTVS